MVPLSALSLDVDKKMSFRNMVSNLFVVAGTVLWIFPMLFKLFFRCKGDRWVFSPDTAKRLLSFEFTDNTRNISEASAIEVHALKVLPFEAIQRETMPKADLVGGERFGVLFFLRAFFHRAGTCCGGLCMGFLKERHSPLQRS